MSQITVEQEKVEYRRKRVYLLKNQGCKNQHIAEKIGVSLSTIEKDLKEIRSQLKDWFIDVTKNDQCGALVSSILQLELVLNKLWNFFRDEKDPREARKILSQIVDTSIKRTQLFESAKHVNDYVNDQMNLHKNPKSISFMDLISEEDIR